MSLSDIYEDLVLDHLFGKTALGQPTLYVGLCLADPGENCTGVSCDEVDVLTHPSYARALADESFWYDPPHYGEICNKKAITFPEAEEEWGLITHFVILTASAFPYGDVVVYGRLEDPNTGTPTPKLVVVGSTPRFDIVALRVHLD